jgi:hypothetical protein
MDRITQSPQNYEAIRTGIVELVRSARSTAARSVNSLMTAAYWEIGRRIVQSEQQGEAQAEYGEQLIERLAVDLSKQFGRGFRRTNLWQMRAFYQVWPEKKILQTPSGESVRDQTSNPIVHTSSIIPTLATNSVERLGELVSRSHGKSSALGTTQKSGVTPHLINHLASGQGMAV